MGLPEQAPSSQDSFLAVEFDTNFDPFLEDLNDNHIGVDLNSVKSLSSVDVVPRGVDLKSGREMTAWIQYINQERMIRIWVGHNSQIRPPDPILESQIDLSTQFKEFMHVGFTAAIGKGSAVYSIDHWKFKTFEFVSPAGPTDTIDEADCLMCISGDNDIGRNGTSGYHNLVKRFNKLLLSYGGISAAVVLLFAIIVLVWVCLTRKGDNREQNEVQICRFQGNRVPHRWSLNEIRSATEGFNRERIVGEGASAVVYEGSIPSRGVVAVKRFIQGNKFGPSHIPFNTEFASMVGCLRHKNLIQLQGWCCERNELVLVYEFMSNGSLDKLLHTHAGFNRFLTWERRLNIVHGVASALIYLHEECESQIIHRDVKSCNIMLDADFNAKLGDFGLAEVFDNSKARDTTVPAGTMGYLAPEYAFSGAPTVKTDVYSFGVVVLEVASGRRPVDEEGVAITDWMWDLWEKGRITEAADPRFSGRFNREQMDRVLMVGLCCVHPDHERRPRMREAARMLKGEAPLPILPSRKPTIRIQSVLPEGCEELMNPTTAQLDNDTPWSTPRTHFSRN